MATIDCIARGPAERILNRYLSAATFQSGLLQRIRLQPAGLEKALSAAALFLGLSLLFALTRSHWLDDWDSVGFAFDDFDVSKHHQHPPGFPIVVAAGKLVGMALTPLFWFQSCLPLTIYEFHG